MRERGGGGEGRGGKRDREREGGGGEGRERGTGGEIEKHIFGEGERVRDRVREGELERHRESALKRTGERNERRCSVAYITRVPTCYRSFFIRLVVDVVQHPSLILYRHVYFLAQLAVKWSIPSSPPPPFFSTPYPRLTVFSVIISRNSS